MIVVPGWRAAAIRAFSVVVSLRSVSTIGRVGSIDAVDGGVVVPLGRLHLEAERAQRRHVRLDGAGAELAAAGVRELEGVGTVEQGTEEHQHRPGTPGGRLVDRAEVELLGRDDLEIALVADPPGVDAEAAQHLEQAVDLLDPGDLAQRRLPAVEQRGAEQGDAGVLRGLDVDLAGQRGRAGDPQVGRAGTERDDLGVEGGADAGDHLQGEVLMTLLDAVDRALAGLEAIGQLLLREPAVGARVADQIADAALEVLRHEATVSHV